VVVHDAHRADARAHVAADAHLGGGGGDQPLVVRDLARVVAEEGAGEPVVHDARDLDLVHREDHRGGGAVVAERLAQARDLRDVEAEAAVLLRHVGAEEFLVLSERIAFSIAKTAQNPERHFIRIATGHRQYARSHSHLSGSRWKAERFLWPG